MVMEFIITPHTRNIIVGRKESRDEERTLDCVAKKCVHPTREIKVTGYVICQRCNTKVLYPDNLNGNVLLCPSCKNDIPLKDDKGVYIVKWTQRVVSKHRRSKHDYFHGECFDAMYVDVE